MKYNNLLSWFCQLKQRWNNLAEIRGIIARFFFQQCMFQSQTSSTWFDSDNIFNYFSLNPVWFLSEKHVILDKQHFLTIRTRLICKLPVRICREYSTIREFNKIWSLSSSELVDVVKKRALLLIKCLGVYLSSFRTAIGRSRLERIPDFCGRGCTTRPPDLQKNRACSGDSWTYFITEVYLIIGGKECKFSTFYAHVSVLSKNVLYWRPPLMFYMLEGSIKNNNEKIDCSLKTPWSENSKLLMVIVYRLSHGALYQLLK